MKGVYLFVLCLSFSMVALSDDHTVSFTYDNGGNRTTMRVIHLPSPHFSPMMRSEATEVFTDSIGDFKLAVHPNPTKGHLLLELLGLPETAIYHYTIHDQAGKLIIDYQGNENPSEADLSEYPAGMYLLNLYCGDSRKEYKIIKL